MYIYSTLLKKKKNNDFQHNIFFLSLTQNINHHIVLYILYIEQNVNILKQKKNIIY